MTSLADEAPLRECAALIGHEFRDIALLRLALTHSSFSAEHDDEPSNERLEFLGDAAVGLVLADEMYRRHANFDEWVLTDLRKSVVNAQALAIAARRLGLGRFIRLGCGEADGGGANKTSILASAFVAVLGAVLLDAGSKASHQLSLRLLAPESADAVPGLKDLDPKTQLQELVAERELGMPMYEVRDEGPAPLMTRCSSPT